MIELIPMTAENVVGIRIAGKIEKTDMEKITAVIDEKTPVAPEASDLCGVGIIRRHLF